MRFPPLRFACLLVLVPNATNAQHALSGPRVTVNEGVLLGKTIRFIETDHIHADKAVDVFLGVPYANPQVRFSPAKRKSPWTGDYNATEFKPACLQAPSALYPVQSEDCLYLNIYVPRPKPSNAAVMVWFHGGSFTEGTAMTYGYYGIPLVAIGDVIVVTPNYRLGIFGQFSPNDVTAAGNLGMLDQVAALRWIHENIEAFGGDVSRITLFGESAGSASVNFHLLSKLSRNYFSQAIMQSGSALSPWAFRHRPHSDRSNAIALGRWFNCDVTNSSALVTCLRTLDATELKRAADKIYHTYPVTIDGTFLIDTPFNLYQSEDFKSAKILMGFSRDEMSMSSLPGYFPRPPISRESFEESVSNMLSLYELDEDLIQKVVFHEYIDWTTADNPDTDYWRPLIDFSTDLNFACATNKVLRAHAQREDIIYEYFMTHVPSRSIHSLRGYSTYSWLGSSHGEILPLVFGWPFIPEIFHLTGFNLTREEKAFSVQIMKTWTNFAKTGDPNAPNSHTSEEVLDGLADDWPAFTLPELHYKELSQNSSNGRALKARECHFWRGVVPQLRNVTDRPHTDDHQEAWRRSFEGWQSNMEEWKEEFLKYKQKTEF